MEKVLKIIDKYLADHLLESSNPRLMLNRMRKEIEALGQLEPQVSLRLRHKYSGEDSKLFWELVNAMGERQQEFYSLGVVLQNLEGWILTQMKYEAPNFVEDEQASN